MRRECNKKNICVLMRPVGVRGTVGVLREVPGVLLRRVGARGSDENDNDNAHRELRSDKASGELRSDK